MMWTNCSDTLPLIVLPGQSFQDSYTRFRRFGLALRPFLKEAIYSEHLRIGNVLARVPEAWRNARADGSDATVGEK